MHSLTNRRAKKKNVSKIDIEKKKRKTKLGDTLCVLNTDKEKRVRNKETACAKVGVKN